jgi:polysaccharide export outer membrane protein
MSLAPRTWRNRARAARASVFAFLLAGSLAGCASSVGDMSQSQSGALPTVTDEEAARLADKYTATNRPGAGQYKIGPQDVLSITVFNVEELKRDIQVADNGSINFPLVGEVKVAGKTPREVERDLAAKLDARFVKSPQVSVFVKEYNSQHFTVDGSVKKPGVFPLRDKSTLTEAIASAGGLDMDSSSSQVVLFRQTTEGRVAARYDIDEIRAGHAADPSIQDGDSIVVDSSQGKVILGYFSKVTPAASLFRVVP